ncbi:hypothetical protein HBI56_039360 [Parastagonospora nodorum]|nr:hypothetical protein HBH52_044910 [Parastagonospora nodorum]KAH3988267.1 hypothetical protein HBH51_004150 [Parastagonospora nodorum]KAH4040378.1 hypothetical protein HBI09_027260 [Parastagonospora nodorum]KAH4071304.1 hypothetical protein HBH50_079020 [Parastagonospora nodorum]KAH4093999.1 hypothetical protein HBH48_067270 [Parastagonospora nodorum]
MQQDAVTRPPLRKRQRVEESHEHASPHVLRALYELPAPIYDAVPLQGVQLWLSVLASGEQKQIVIVSGGYKWLVNDFMLRITCNRIGLLLHESMGTQDTDYPDHKLITIPPFPLAMEKVLVYWYTREHHVTTDASIRYARTHGSSAPTTLTAIDKPLLVVEMATIAALFGDYQLEANLFRRFRSLISHFEAFDFVKIVELLFQNQFDEWTTIDGIRALLALHVVRNDYDRISHPKWSSIINQALYALPEFKEKLVWAIQAEAKTKYLPAEVDPEDQNLLTLTMGDGA